MKIVPYILYLFLLALHMTLLSDFLSIQGFSINLAVLLVSLIAFYKEELVALWFGVFVGIVYGSVDPSIMPWQVLMLAVIALVVHQLSIGMNLDSITSRLIILVVAIFVHTIISSALISTDDFFYNIYRIILPSTLYTLVIGWLFFLIKDSHVTGKKIKSLF